MIERILEQHQALYDVLSHSAKTRHLVLSGADITVLESVNKTIAPLQEFTDALSAESYVSVSYVKPVLHLMETDLLVEKEGDSQLTESIRRNILDYMNTKFDDEKTQDLLDMASFVDPRFKITYISSEKVAVIKDRVLSEMKAATTQVIKLGYNVILYQAIGLVPCLIIRHK